MPFSPFWENSIHSIKCADPERGANIFRFDENPLYNVGRLEYIKNMEKASVATN